MKKFFKNVLAVVAVGILAMFLETLPLAQVFADEILSSMTVSPPTQRMILMPGETYSGSLKISNSNDNKNDLKYSASIGSFSQVKDGKSKDDYGSVDHISRSNYNQIMDWIELDKETGTVAPNSTDVLSYKINVPKDAPAGGQYATIIIRDETVNSDEDSGNVAIQNVMQFGSIIYAEVTGETREAGAILENNVPMISFGSPLMVSSIVKNDGNVHTDAEYTLQIYPLFSDKEVYSNEEEPMTSLILPESERYNALTWDEAPMVGIFKVRQTVKIFGDTSVVEKIVIICPLWLLFIIIIAIALIIFWLVSKSKKRQKN